MIKRFLKKTDGYTLVVLLFVITIFSIVIIPIYKMIIMGAKVQKTAEKTYEATFQAQSLLEGVKKQIEKDVGMEYAHRRGLTSLDLNPWMMSDITHPVYSIPAFLGINDEAGLIGFNKKYSTSTFLYELYIWPMPEGRPVQQPIVFSTYPLRNPSHQTRLEIQKSAEKYFSYQEMLLWGDIDGSLVGSSGRNLVGIGEITHQETDNIKVRGNGLEGENISLKEIEGYTSLEKKVKLIYKYHLEHFSISRSEPTKKETVITHEIVIREKIPLEDRDIIQLSIDLTTFPLKDKSEIIRIENKTKATVVIPIYNEKDLGNIQIYPIQENLEGNMIVERCNKLEPRKNFIIGIVVKEALNNTFGPDEKVLGKLVDIYAYDYNQ